MRWRRRRREPKEFPFDFFGLEVVIRPRDARVTQRYLRDFMALERVRELEEGEEVDEPGRRVPADLALMLEQEPDVFEFYRHSVYAYLDRTVGLNPWHTTLRSLWLRLDSVDQSGSRRFLDSAWNAGERYARQRANARRSLPERLDLEAPDQYDLRSALSAYAAAYEIDVPLWFLGVLGKAYREGRFAPTAFGGPATSTPQTSLIEDVLSALEGTPLAAPFADAYDSDLRNSIGHNDYAIEKQNPRGPFEIRDNKSGRRWGMDEFASFLQGTWALLQAIEHCVQFMQQVVRPSAAGDFADRGLTNLAFAVRDDGRPMLLVAQLWCFRDIDPHGRWLDNAQLLIESAAESQEKVGFTEHAYTVGEPVSTTPWGEALREWGWAHVRRVPVAPDLGLGFPRYERMHDGRFEIVGDADEHIVEAS